MHDTSNLLFLAYLDPGSGAMILQAVVAGVAGLIVFLKYQGRRIKAMFTGSQKTEKSGEDSVEG